MCATYEAVIRHGTRSLVSMDDRTKKVKSNQTAPSTFKSDQLIPNSHLSRYWAELYRSWPQKRLKWKNSTCRPHTDRLRVDRAWMENNGYQTFLAKTYIELTCKRLRRLDLSSSDFSFISGFHGGGAFSSGFLIYFAKSSGSSFPSALRMAR